MRLCFLIRFAHYNLQKGLVVPRRVCDDGPRAGRLGSKLCGDVPWGTNSGVVVFVGKVYLVTGQRKTNRRQVGIRFDLFIGKQAN
jgi:hypothetical protein